MDNDEPLGPTVKTTNVDIPTSPSNADGTHNGDLSEFIICTTLLAHHDCDTSEHTSVSKSSYGRGGTILKAKIVYDAVNVGTKATTVNGNMLNTSTNSKEYLTEISYIEPAVRLSNKQNYQRQET